MLYCRELRVTGLECGCGLQPAVAISAVDGVVSGVLWVQVEVAIEQ